jgi:multiple sugar transport system permease protein
MRRAFLYLFLTTLAFIFLFPFLWMLLTSLKPQGTGLVLSLPKKPTLENFRLVLFKFKFYRFFLNSLIIATGSAFISTLFASLAAFAFAKRRFFMKNLLFALFLSSMMVPGLLYVVPQFLVIYKLRWVNTYWGMIVPHLANVFGLFLLTQFMREIPDSLLEAARIDGASEIFLWKNIIVPLSLPIIATVFLLNFQFHWSNFLWQLIVAQDETMYTVPVGLAMFKSAHEEAYTLEMAASSLSIIPIGILFLFAQRYFIQGITQGAIKG